MADRSAAAEGWYRDPYGIHQDRWFSAGTPTALVRDQGVEGRDDPPGYPPLEPPAEIPEVDEFPADDLRRADEKEADGGHYDAERVAEQAGDAATSGFGGYGLWPSEPPGDGRALRLGVQAAMAGLRWPGCDGRAAMAGCG